VLEAHLPDGSRVEAIIPPAAPDGPCVSIRRFARNTLTADRLLALDAITPDALSFVTALVACKQNIIVAGGTNSGKTSLLNVLSSFCGSDERSSSSKTRANCSCSSRTWCNWKRNRAITRAGAWSRSGYRIIDLFTRVHQTGSTSVLRPTGALPRCLPLLQAHGFELPTAMIAASRSAS
jgi:hypothetical protein